MNFQDYQGYVIAFLGVCFFAWRFWRFKKIKSALPELIKNGATIIDVRSPGEFLQGSRPGSINIPLNDLNQRLKEIDKNKNVILCCASGARSGVATTILKKNGFNNVVNAGPWTNTLV
jgi:rhodanese-related sulfurtransferase